MSWGKTDQEVRVNEIYSSLEAAFKRADKLRDPDKVQAVLREVTKKLKDAKT